MCNIFSFICAVASIYSAVIFLKFCLWLYCRRFKKSPIARALAQDHINDVGSNSVALVALVIASEFPNLSLLDPIGAIIISLWIIWSWYDTGKYSLCFILLTLNQFVDLNFTPILKEGMK